MPLTTIYIARHGYRANWLPPPHPPNPTGIDSDPPLAPHGLDQAKELAHYILSIEPKPACIFSSPFYRCLQTATPIADVLNIDIELEAGVGEWYKPDRPVIPKPATVETLQRFFPKLKANWAGTGVAPLPTGETEAQIFTRCSIFLTKFITKFEKEHPEATSVLFMTHAASSIALGMALMGFESVRDYLDDEQAILQAGTCSLTQYTYNRGKWELKMNGNTEFLSKGEEMNWNFHNGFEAGSDEDIKARQNKSQREKEDYEVRRSKI
ncbi:hypothetical protein BABINDRAFT_30876 [Babjeviella inositovora NRRL Y-12698]|uniref:Transcription factor TFIIIC triple barrel domain-containing protein n=1 Tax=Babjeviella inositovora NRRL Y-12698 TaxID=984486 RepID=A0A1E3QY54_9ASCO|nr:uncharacterized protein BABINDRAFT_30876 [Babjeviella inositovora NRRL Y-12698]ODQ82524.1 hypothetical protein BABINDRAFT_30876 [Babjeviella inositovora NRRL Y-12698]